MMLTVIGALSKTLEQNQPPLTLNLAPFYHRRKNINPLISQGYHHSSTHPMCPQHTVEIAPLSYSLKYFHSCFSLSLFIANSLSPTQDAQGHLLYGGILRQREYYRERAFINS
jgi:hypothetical protein